MDAITIEQVLYEIQAVCAASSLVRQIEQRFLDMDILDVRVHLDEGSFISVFYNLRSDKTSFALIRKNKRIYGVDNAKMGWHRHPFESPEKHEPCAPITFREFLLQIEQSQK